MYLLVGLGNPGAKYAQNRHNIGFWAVQDILHRFDFPNCRKKFSSLVSRGDIDAQEAIVLMPQTFMNDSGVAVQQASAFYKIPPEHIWVFHDEIDLEPLKVKVKKGGGDAGHNGLRSITQMFGTPDYWRVRIGVGHPGHKDLVHAHVLKDFSKEEIPAFEALCDNLGRVIPYFLRGDTNRGLTELDKLA